MDVILLAGIEGRVPKTAPVFHRITLNHTGQMPRTLLHLGFMTLPRLPGFHFLCISGLGILIAMTLGTWYSLARCSEMPTALTEPIALLQKQGPTPTPSSNTTSKACLTFFVNSLF